MLIKTRGIVLRSFKYSETSMICEVYTERAGLKKYIVSGVRHKKAKTSPNLLQIMSLLDLVAYNKEGKDLNRPKEIKPFYLYQRLPFDVYRSAIGMFITEVCQKVLRQSEENEPLFQFLLSIYLHLDHFEQSVANTHLYFLLQFTKYLGFMPDGVYSEATPYFNIQEGTFQLLDNSQYTLHSLLSQQIDQLLHASLHDLHLLPISRTQRNDLLDKLLLYFHMHIEGLSPISAHHILKDVLEG